MKYFVKSLIIPNRKEKLLIIVKYIFSDRKKAAIFIVIMLAAAYLFLRGNGDEMPQVQTEKVKKGTIISSVSTSGNVISSNIENVTTQASGTVKKVYISDDDEVYTGQNIAEIDLDVQGQQSQAAAYSTYVGAKRGLNTYRSNYRKTQASLAVVYDEIKGHDDDESLEMKEERTNAEVANDNAYNSVKTSEAKLSSAALALRTTSGIITSPASGTVKSVTIAEGMNIGATETASGARANQRVATIGTEGLPITTFNVSEIDVSLIEPGQKATITLDSIADKTFSGKVVSVDRVGMITNNVTTYTTIVQFDTSSDQILPNMAATANIIIDSKSDVLIVPSQAVNYQDGQESVTVIINGQEQNVLVETGIFNDTQTEIVSGLKEGDTIITTTTSTNQTTQTRRGGFMFGGGGAGRMVH
jgi:RND family efflux transporter MFP subunit